MPDYTVINLRELENMSPRVGHEKAMEARFATKPLALTKSGLGLQKVHPGQSIPFKHKHAKQEEIFIIISGNGSIQLDDHHVALKTWDAVRVPPEVVRTVSAGADGLEMIIVGAPYTGNNDVQMVHDK